MSDASNFQMSGDVQAAMAAELQDVEFPVSASAAPGEPEGGGGAGEVPDQGPDGVTAGEVSTTTPQEPPPAVTEPAAPAGPPARTLSDAEWEQLETYRALDRRLQTDPVFAAQFQRAIQGQEPALPEPPVQQRRPDSYLDGDPAYQELQGSLARLNEVTARHEALLNRQYELENQQVLSTVSTAFKARHNLDDSAYNRVYETAQNYAGVLPGLAARHVPMDQALDQVLETAYWSMPEMREAELARAADQHRTDQVRKAKAGSLSGSSGSVPRTEPAPRNEIERREAMTDFLRSAVGGAAE